MGLCIRNRAVAWRHGLGNWFHREVYLMTKTRTISANAETEPQSEMPLRDYFASYDDNLVPVECGRECQYYDYFEMLWAWFRERRGSEDMRANVANGGLSADDFKQMLDDHEANLIPTEPQSSADSEAFRAALEQLAATARTAVSYVGYANDAKREREAQSWIRKKHEELLALAERFEKSKRYACLQAPTQPAPVETDAPAWHGVQDAIDAWAQKTLGEDAGVIMSWSDRLAQHLAPALPRLSAETRPQSNTGEAS